MFHWQVFITYIFSLSLKFRTCYMTDLCCKFKLKDAVLCSHILLSVFLAVFHQKICVFIISIFFKWSFKFMRQNISQSEIGTGDTKLLVELHNNVKVWQINSFHLADNLANTLATLLEKQKTSLRQRYSRTCFWCHYGMWFVI